MSNPIFRTKSAEHLLAEAGESKLKRSLGAFQLTMLGIGAIIGTGIFVLTGAAAAGTAHADGAGPALTISFIITGFACGLAALCYAEFASMIPISGSAYTYSYASFGELIAWIIGWDLVLEYAVGNIAVAIGWSAYFGALMNGWGIHLPEYLTTDLITGMGKGMGFSINLPAFLITMFVTALLVRGTKESANVNAFLVIVKLILIAAFLIFGLPHFNPSVHWTEFAPNGWQGIMTGAALVFFAYVGFDAVSTTAEEAKNPQKDLPIGMIASLLICTILYIAVAAVLTGMVPLEQLGNAKPVVAALESVGEHSVAAFIAFGVTFTMPSVLLVMQLGQIRVFYAMSRDGLLPKAFSKVHEKFQTPAISTVIVGTFVAVFAALIDIGAAAELTNIGTLFAFVLVAIGVWILRVQDPQRERKFKVPIYQVVCALTVIVCGYLMIALPLETWKRFFFWLMAGILIYYLYGFHNSTLNPVKWRVSQQNMLVKLGYGLAIIVNGLFLFHFFGHTDLIAIGLGGLVSLGYAFFVKATAKDEQSVHHGQQLISMNVFFIIIIALTYIVEHTI